MAKFNRHQTLVALAALAMSTVIKAEDAIEVVVDDHDDNEDSMTIAWIIIGAVTFIVLALLCTYCICSKMSKSQSNMDKIGNK